MYIVRSTQAYRKAYKRGLKQKDFNRQTLEEVIRTLARGDKLAPTFLDHQLSGEFKNYRECHLQHDMLLMYQKHENILVLLLVDLGTHDDLFR